jgi:hypothetical protein
MKMVKSLLLGSAAGLVAIAGAQAADLPVKAKPVQYVKICSLYGAGFYYIPGTDTCLKIGGFVRAEYDFYANGSFFAYQSTNFDSPAQNVDNSRVRFGITADARSQTAYGTLRAFVYMAPTATNGTGGGYYTPYAPVGFIQWAGFTFGLTSSFFNFDGQGYTNGTPWVSSASGGRGMPVFAYTAQFGNGLSATVSLEDNTGHGGGVTSASTTVSSTSTTSTVGGVGVTTATKYTQDTAGREWPDLVGNLRIDQAWGSAQVMGALHEIHSWNAGVANSEQRKIGWAVGAGLKFNLPMLGHGDYVEGEFAYAKGAMEYIATNIVSQNDSGSLALLNGYTTQTGTYASGVTGAALGMLYDAVGGTAGGSLNLTEGWHVTAGYEHHWDPMWKTSLYGSYAAFNYSSAASAVLMPAGAAAGSANFNTWQIGSRTVWTPVENLDFSVDVLYTQLDTAYKGQSTTHYGTLGDKGFVSGIFRVQRNF